MRKKDFLIKVCGMKDQKNIEDVAKLNPDLLGFILYKGSPRYVEWNAVTRLTASIPGTILKVGVLVNEPFSIAREIARSGIFDLIQLHGDENAVYCREISEFTQVIKAFRIQDQIPGDLKDYEPFCRMFLFDTGGKYFGGSGKKFDHKLLSGYSAGKDYLLSGGIAPGDAEYIGSACYSYMAGIDINSRFESEPGIKNIDLLEKFIKKIRKNAEVN